MRTTSRPWKRPRANLVKELDAFLKERIEHDPEGVIPIHEFELEFYHFIEAKGLSGFKGYAVDKARRQKGIKLRSSIKISGVDFDGEHFDKCDGEFVRGFLGLKWKHRKSLTIMPDDGKNRGLSNFKREAE